MGSFSIWHWIVVGAIVLLLFGGKGKISDLMGDVAKGIKSFKKGMSEDDSETARPAEPVRTIEQPVNQATHTNAPPASPSTPVQPVTEPRKVS